MAIVAGGSRGIGRAVVRRLLADGAKVVTCGRGPRPDDEKAVTTLVQGDVSRTADAALSMPPSLDLGASPRS